MRIVQLNPFYFPYAGGIERRIRAVSERLAARGHDVHIVTAQQPGTQAGATMEGKVTVHRLPSRFPLRRFYNPPMVATKGVAAAVEAIAPDVVDYHFRWSPSWNRAFRAMRVPGKVATIHNTYGEGTGPLVALSRLNDKLYLRTLRHAQRVLCVSDFVRQEFARHGAKLARMDVSYNAVDPPANEPVSSQETLAPKPYAVAVCRMVPLKGLDLLLEAWPQVHELDLVLVGDGPHRAKLAQRAERLGLRGRVRFTGWVSEDEKVRLLRGAIVYLHPSRFEAFGLSILEAMAEGAPVVCSDAGGIPEAVGSAGPLLRRDAALWTTAINRLADDPAAVAAARQASLAQAKRFDWDRIVDGIEAAYASAAATGRGSVSAASGSSTSL